MKRTRRGQRTSVGRGSGGRRGEGEKGDMGMANGGTQKGSDSGKINPPPKTRYDKGDRLHWGGGFHHPI